MIWLSAALWLFTAAFIGQTARKHRARRIAIGKAVAVVQVALNHRERKGLSL